MELTDGRLVRTPLSFYPTLEAASPAERLRFRSLGRGAAFAWDDFDLQLSARSIAEGQREHVPPPQFWAALWQAQERAGVKVPPQLRRAQQRAQSMGRAPKNIRRKSA